MRPRRTALVVSLLLAPVAVAAQGRTAWPPDSARHRSPFAGEAVLAATAGGMFLAFGISAGMARAGATVLGPRGGEDPGLVGAVVGYATGLALGSSLGAYVVGRAYGFPVRYGDALTGALAGVLVLPLLPIDLDRPASIVLLYLVPGVGAAVVSALGASSRIARPQVRALREGVGVGIAVSLGG